VVDDWYKAVLELSKKNPGEVKYSIEKKMFLVINGRCGDRHIPLINNFGGSGGGNSGSNNPRSNLGSGNTSGNPGSNTGQGGNPTGGNTRGLENSTGSNLNKS
ncbi:23289_t:CDS:2, partial [Dentiscutata erythropus]